MDLKELFLNTPLLDGQALAWGSTDTGLEFQVSIAGLSVPEPASVTLLLLGLLILLATTYVDRQRVKARHALTQSFALPQPNTM